jgi:hypothetical protein
MEVEDDYLLELQDKERFIDRQNRLLEEKDRAIEELKKQLAEALRPRSSS